MDYSQALNRDAQGIKTAARFDTVENDWVHSILPAQRDTTARAIDDILDCIGAENVKLFLPMWEESGTKAYDLLRRDLTFTYNGPTLAQPGPFGKCPSFDGVNDYLIQDSITEQPTTTGGENPLWGGQKLATRMKDIATKIGFIRLQLRKSGNPGSAVLRTAIYTDNAGVPGSPVTNGLSDTLPTSGIVADNTEIKGFTFPTAPELQKNQKYWIVLEYTDSTGIDGSNYIAWKHDAATSGYGERNAIHDGSTWTITDGYNNSFWVYGDDLILDGDFSIITAASNTAAIPAYKSIVGAGSMTFHPTVGISLSLEGNLYARSTDSSERTLLWYSWPSKWFTNVLTFSVEKSTGKTKLYANGLSVVAADGTANVKQVRPAQPFTIGALVPVWGTEVLQHWEGKIGPVIITKTELTPTQVGKVSQALIALRKYGWEA